MHYFHNYDKIIVVEINIPDSLIKLSNMTSLPIYVVGGYVRNKIAGLGETDIDIAGPAVADALGLSKRYRTEVINYKLGTVVIKYNEDKFEYTPFRVEKYAEGGGGRPTPWKYQDAQGIWHWTAGNRAHPFIKPSIADHQGTYKNILKDELTKGD